MPQMWPSFWEFFNLLIFFIYIFFFIKLYYLFYLRSFFITFVKGFKGLVVLW